MAKIVFQMPEGNAEFDELEPGEKMPFRGTLRKEEDGSACLVTVDGQTVEGYSDEDEEESEETEEGAEEEEAGFDSALSDMMV